LVERTPQETYVERRADFAIQRDAYAQRSGKLSNIRLVVFAVAMLLAGAAIAQSAWWWLAVLGTIVGFVAIVIKHHEVEQTRLRYAELWTINDEGMQRLRRDWATLPLRQAPEPAPPASYASDLDVFGHASLAHLLGTASTPVGLGTLRGWLLEPATPAVIAQRQAAVRELAPLVDWRDELALRGREVKANQQSYERFLVWAESGPTLITRPLVLWIAWILPALTIGAFIGYFIGVFAVPWWLILGVISLLYANSVGGAADRIIVQVAARQNSFASFAALFRLINTQTFSAPELQRLQTVLRAGDLRADEQMARLGRIMTLADQRFSLLYIVLQAFTVWNIQVGWLLERWQRDAGSSARSWLAVLGEIEALAALATLQHDNPTWAMPQISVDGAICVSATQIAHPLLPPDAAVPNDVSVGPAGTFLLITGSNMSGKSTLLRALGLNVVLAQAGGPVCAAAFQLPALTLATSMRISDSLEGGISYFMAELLRLKTILDIAEHSHAVGRTTLFLLDEILHGTNTSERQIAARQIIKHLLRFAAIGAVSTHDLTLAAAPDIAATSQPFYFTEQFSRGPAGPLMEFDYTLRPGLAPSTNALKLMEIIGLPTED
jgi:ABC-type multidrug transport system fused ATPase/permease subunit